MKTSVIRHRVADFLRQYPPFDAVGEENLLALTSSGRVQFFESESYVFEQGRQRANVVWVIQQGTVEIWNESGEARQTDLLGPGDILGVDRFFGESVYFTSARTASDVILYSIDAALFEDLMRRLPAVGAYVLAHTDVQARAKDLTVTWVEAAAPPLECLEHSAGHALTAKDGQSAGAYFLQMLHACVDELQLEDSGRALPAGMLALFSGQNPVRLADELQRASGPAQWSPLLRLANRMTVAGLDSHSAARLSAPIATQLNNAFVRAAIRQAVNGVDGLAGIPHAWIAFGRSAREEMTLQRRPRLTVLHDSSDPRTIDLFQRVAASVRRLCTESGLPDPRDDSSDLPPSQRISGFISSLALRIRQPIMHPVYPVRMLLDATVIDGDRSLFAKFSETIEAELKANPVCLSVLANDTLSRLPPLSFFGDLVVDLDGERRESFDLFTVAVQPIVDAARVLSLAQGSLTPISTVQRLESARAAYPQLESIFKDAVSAFEVALYYQARARIRNPAQATIRPSDLNRYDQRVLKTAFQSVQRLLEWTADTFVAGGTQ